MVAWIGYHGSQFFIAENELVCFYNRISEEFTGTVYVGSTMPELVSIIIPAYNAEKWIAQTLRSAIAQTWPQKEVVVIDDGSIDGTLAIARSFESRFVKVIAQMNAGPCVARNAGLALAQGDYIQWLDADDLLAPDKIEHQMRRSEGGRQSKILLSSAFGTFFHRPHKAIFRPTSLWQDLKPIDWLIHKFLENVTIVTHAWLVSRKIAELAGPWDLRMWKTDDDGEYFCRVVAVSEAVRFVPEARCYYRKGLGNSLSMMRTDLKREELAFRLYITHLLALEDSDRTRDVCLNFLQREADSFYLANPYVVNVAGGLAREIGRSLAPVHLSLKYRVAIRMLGRNGAFQARNIVARTKLRIYEKWDKLLSLFSR